MHRRSYIRHDRNNMCCERVIITNFTKYFQATIRSAFCPLSPNNKSHTCIGEAPPPLSIIAATMGPCDLPRQLWWRLKIVSGNHSNRSPIWLECTIRTYRTVLYEGKVEGEDPSQLYRLRDDFIEFKSKAAQTIQRTIELSVISMMITYQLHSKEAIKKKTPDKQDIWYQADTIPRRLIRTQKANTELSAAIGRWDRRWWKQDQSFPEPRIHSIHRKQEGTETVRKVFAFSPYIIDTSWVFVWYNRRNEEGEACKGSAS